MPIKLKVKKLHKDAAVPKYANIGDAGLDLVCVSKNVDENGNLTLGTGLSFEIPVGFVGLLFPRSSISKYGVFQRNSVGVIDSGYRGEVMMKFGKLQSVDGKEYEIGEKMGQLVIVPIPEVELLEVDELSSTDRGEGSFGSTGK